MYFNFRNHVKEFLDLRGCQWAYSNDDSLSGSTIVLKNLRELGENASFFGNTISMYNLFFMDKNATSLVTLYSVKYIFDVLLLQKLDFGQVFYSNSLSLDLIGV